MKLDIPRLKRLITDKFRLRPGAEQLLKALVAEGKQVLLVTNAHPISLQLKMQQSTHHLELFHQDCLRNKIRMLVLEKFLFHLEIYLQHHYFFELILWP